MKPISSIYGRKAATGINWITFIAMTVYHIGSVAAFFYIDSGAILAAAIPGACQVKAYRNPVHLHR